MFKKSNDLASFDPEIYAAVEHENQRQEHAGERYRETADCCRRQPSDQGLFDRADRRGARGGRCFAC